MRVINVCEQCMKADNLTTSWKKQRKSKGFACSLCFCEGEFGKPIQTVKRVSFLPNFLFEKTKKIVYL